MSHCFEEWPTQSLDVQEAETGLMIPVSPGESRHPSLRPCLASLNAWCLFLSRRLQKELQNLQRHGIDADMVRIDQWMQDFHKFRQSAVWSVQTVTWHDATTVWIYMCADPMGKTHSPPEPWELIRTMLKLGVICLYGRGLAGERLPLPMVQVNHRLTVPPEASAVHLWLSEFGRWRPEPPVSHHITHTPWVEVGPTACRVEMPVITPLVLFCGYSEVWQTI